MGVASLSAKYVLAVRGAIGVRCPELGGVRSRRFKCTVSLGKSIGGMLYRVCPLFGGSIIRSFTVLELALKIFTAVCNCQQNYFWHFLFQVVEYRHVL